MNRRHAISEPLRQRVVLGLLAMKRAGLLTGLWIDAEQIRIQRGGIERGISWPQADDLVRKFRRKESNGTRT